MPTLKTLDGPEIELVCACLDCRVKHAERVPAISQHQGFLRLLDEWENKHGGHATEYYSPRRHIPRDLDDSVFEQEGIAPWWLDFDGFKENSNIKIAYASSVAMTFTSVNSLATDTNLLAGASALAVDNSSNLYLDYTIAGLIKNNTSSAPTAGQEIDVYAYRGYDDTPTYPDTLAGTDALKTITTSNILNTLGRLVASMKVAATTSQVNPFDGGSVAALWGGHLPKLWSIFVVHNSGQALAASGNSVSYRGAYATSV